VLEEKETERKKENNEDCSPKLNFRGKRKKKKEKRSQELHYTRLMKSMFVSNQARLNCSKEERKQ